MQELFREVSLTNDDDVVFSQMDASRGIRWHEFLHELFSKEENQGLFVHAVVFAIVSE